jgi:hypothetical protein
MGDSGEFHNLGEPFGTSDLLTALAVVAAVVLSSAIVLLSEYVLLLRVKRRQGFPFISGEIVPRVVGRLVVTRNTGCYPPSLSMTTKSETDEDEIRRMSSEGSCSSEKGAVVFGICEARNKIINA